jgi:hypothetical protein
MMASTKMKVCLYLHDDLSSLNPIFGLYWKRAYMGGLGMSNITGIDAKQFKTVGAEIVFIYDLSACCLVISGNTELLDSVECNQLCVSVGNAASDLRLQNLIRVPQLPIVALKSKKRSINPVSGTEHRIYKPRCREFSVNFVDCIDRILFDVSLSVETACDCSLYLQRELTRIRAYRACDWIETIREAFCSKYNAHIKECKNSKVFIEFNVSYVGGKNAAEFVRVLIEKGYGN